jgi:branched-subunit amino acid transport protein
MMIFLTVLGMGAILFFNRYVFLEPRLPLRLGQRTRDFLTFAVPGMLTAICGPIIFMPDHRLDLSLLNPYLLGSIAAVVFMLWTRRVLTSVVLSAAMFYLLRWLI